MSTRSAIHSLNECVERFRRHEQVELDTSTIVEARLETIEPKCLYVVYQAESATQVLSGDAVERRRWEDWQ